MIDSICMLDMQHYILKQPPQKDYHLTLLKVQQLGKSVYIMM